MHQQQEAYRMNVGSHSGPEEEEQAGQAVNYQHCCRFEIIFISLIYWYGVYYFECRSQSEQPFVPRVIRFLKQELTQSSTPYGNNKTKLPFSVSVSQINERSSGIQRGYDDLMQWQAKTNAKQQLLQKFKSEEETRKLEQDSRQVFTNAESNRILAEQRRAQHVEDTLLQKGEEAKIKRIQKEQELYGSLGKPQVNNKYSSQYTQKDVYTRLYSKAIEQQQQRDIQQKVDYRQSASYTQQPKRFLSPQSQESTAQQQETGNNWKSQVYSTAKLFKKPTADASEEQAKLMAAMRANFQSAKAHLLYQKGIVDQARQKQETELEQEERKRLLELEQLNQQRQSGSTHSSNLQKQIEFGVSAGKPQGHEDTALVNSLIGMNEIEMQLRAKEIALQQQKEEQEEVDNQAASRSADNRIIFLAPEAKENQRRQQNGQIFPNVMSPKTVILEQEKVFFKSSSQVDVKEKDPDIIKVQSGTPNQSQGRLFQESQISQPQSGSFSLQLQQSFSQQQQQLLEKKASEQFKQYFKPLTWNAEAARLILESKSNSILGDTVQEANNQMNQASQLPGKAAITHQQQLDYLVQNYPILTSQQQQSLQASLLQVSSKQTNGPLVNSLGPQNMQEQQQLQQQQQQYQDYQLQQQQAQQQQQSQPQEKSSSLPQSQQNLANSLYSPLNVSQHSSLYAKTMLKQMEEGTQGTLDPKCVYVDFRYQSQDRINMCPPLAEHEKLTQKEVDEIFRRQCDWLQQKDLRIKEKQEQKIEKELDGCTFKPDLSLSAWSSAKKLAGLSMNEQSQQVDTSQQHLVSDQKKQQSGLGYSSKINLTSYAAVRQSRQDYKQPGKVENPQGESSQENQNNENDTVGVAPNLQNNSIVKQLIGQGHQQEDEEANFHFGLPNEEAQEISRQLQQNSQEIQAQQ